MIDMLLRRQFRYHIRHLLTLTRHDLLWPTPTASILEFPQDAALANLVPSSMLSTLEERRSRFFLIQNRFIYFCFVCVFLFHSFFCFHTFVTNRNRNRTPKIKNEISRFLKNQKLRTQHFLDVFYFFVLFFELKISGQYC